MAADDSDVKVDELAATDWGPAEWSDWMPESCVEEAPARERRRR